MNETVIEVAPHTLAATVKNNLYDLFELFSQSAKADVYQGRYGLRWRTSFAHPWFNGVLSKQPPGHDATQIIQDAVDYFKDSGVASFSWWLAPDLDPTAWGIRLQAQGFQYTDQTPGMAIDLCHLPAQAQNSVTIRPVTKRSALADYARTLVRGFGMAESMVTGFIDLFGDLDLAKERPLRHYLGYLDGEPVATSTLFLGRGAAGIYNVATLPAARGRGVGSAMTLAPLYEAQTLNYKTGVLQSSSMGYRVYQRLGFETVGQVDHYYWQAQ